MIENRISELLGKRRESITDLSRGATISYPAAHALYHHTSKGITFEVLDRLCAYFDCQVGDLFVRVPDGAPS